MTNHLTTTLAVVGVSAFFACAGSNDYAYSPQTANEVIANTPASRTPIPQESPQGAVEVASYGITELHPNNTSIPVLHVRMLVTNDGDATPWQVDTREQYVAIDGEGRSRAMYVNSDAKVMPIVPIAAHEKHVFDMYFPLPGSVTSEERLPHFTVQWQVTTPARLVSSSTAFDRFKPESTTETTVAYDPAWPYWAGYGPYWWYDPAFGSTVFVHTRPIVIRDHRGGRMHVGHFHGHFSPGGHIARRGGRR